MQKEIQSNMRRGEGTEEDKRRNKEGKKEGN
jgi:hypothetical protein